MRANLAIARSADTRSALPGRWRGVLFSGTQPVGRWALRRLDFPAPRRLRRSRVRPCSAVPASTAPEAVTLALRLGRKLGGLRRRRPRGRFGESPPATISACGSALSPLCGAGGDTGLTRSLDGSSGGCDIEAFPPGVIGAAPDRGKRLGSW